MARDRCKNRRTSFSGVLTENTNVIENKDPLWANRTSVRPSTSFDVTREASALLNSCSEANTSRASVDWYNYLSHSDTSKIIREFTKRNIYLDEENPQTASESDEERPKKKRKKVKLYRQKKVQSEKSNEFIEELNKSSERSVNKTKKDHQDVPKSFSNSDTSSSPVKVRQRSRFASVQKNKYKHSISPDISQKFKEALRADERNATDSQDRFIEEKISNKLADKTTSKKSSVSKSSNKSSRYSEKRDYQATLKHELSVFQDNPLLKSSNNQTRKTSALHDVQNTIPITSINKPRIIQQKVMLPDSENYIPLDKIFGKHRVPTLTGDGPTKDPRCMLKSSTTEAPKTNLPYFSESEMTEVSDDLCPTAAQSTLHIHGKPLTEIPCRLSIIHGTPNTTKRSEERQMNVGSGPEESPARLSLVLSPSSSEFEKNKTSLTDDEAIVEAFFNDKPTKRREDFTSSYDPSIWAEVKKKTDLIKARLESNDKLAKEAQRLQERKKAAIDAKLQRMQAQREILKRNKLKKPIDKAYFVDGKPYKQPKLPRPKRWVTKRLYKYLWKTMEPRFGLETRIRSEKFVLKLSAIYTVIVRRSKYENYVEELNDLLVEMARLGLVENRYDFYRFCSDYMPPSFHNKVVPMMLPGNRRNIPYEPKLVYEPILDKSDHVDSSLAEESKSRDEIGMGSESE